ncbi:hypothetical protein ACW5R3_11495 [Bizionia sp. KMM 8389]
MLITFSFNGIAQSNTCAENITIASKTYQPSGSNLPEQIISWELTDTSTSDVINIEFEFQPLNSCWNKLDGSIRSESIIRKTGTLAKKPNGKVIMTYKDLNAKCYKWRTKISNNTTNCESLSKWQFYSFL